jgi:hypothetical protein
MSRQRGASGNDTDDGRPELISLEDKHAAERMLREELAAGKLDEAEFKRRLGRVYRAVTPRELWKASGHRAGSRKRSDWPELRKALRLQVAIVVFAILAMLVVLFGTVIYQQGGSTADRNIFPWEWGQD